MNVRPFDPVLAAPHDMSVRRTFADAIRSEQPKWGELIDLQLAIREKSRAGEPALDSDISRSRELIREIGDHCCGPIASVASHWHYWGGMVEEVRVDARRFADAIPALKGFVPLRMLSLTHLQGNIPEVLRWPILGQLVALDVGENNLTDDAVAALAASPFLQELRVVRIAGNPCGYGALKALDALPKLRFINADDTNAPLRNYFEDERWPGGMDFTHAQGVMEAELGDRPWITGALDQPSFHEL